MPHWNPDQYLHFASERTQPAVDLLVRIHLAAPRTIIDLGCGPGNSTALLHERWPAANILGLDSSQEMIHTACATHPTWQWQRADISQWTATTLHDLVFSNAALQWVPDHPRLLPHLLSQVAPDGALAVQMPAHLTSPVHQAMLAIARDPAWCDRMQQAAGAVVVHTPQVYYDLLQPLAERIDLWVTEYLHVLDNPAAVIEWMRGTGLRPFLHALSDEAERSDFERRLLAEVERGYPRQADGRVLLPFRRLFLLAYRDGNTPPG
jgi:trans-aconitate 2-methyltransferase